MQLKELEKKKKQIEKQLKQEFEAKNEEMQQKGKQQWEGYHAILNEIKEHKQKAKKDSQTLEE